MSIGTITRLTGWMKQLAAFPKHSTLFAQRVWNNGWFGGAPYSAVL